MLVLLLIVTALQAYIIGGINGAIKILKRELKKDRVDIKKFVRFAAKFPIIKVRKRIGLLTEEMGYSNNELAPLAESVKGTAISSLTGSYKGTLNKKWNVIVNDSQR